MTGFWHGIEEHGNDAVVVEIGDEGEQRVLIEELQACNSPGTHLESNPSFPESSCWRRAKEGG